MRYFCLSMILTMPMLAADDRAQEEAAAAEKLFVAELPNWKLTADGTLIDNPKEPVLRWTNPFAGRVYGNTYVWLQNGRPIAAGCLFRNVQPWNTFNGELAALTGKKLVAARNDKVLWKPENEWKWTNVPGAPSPSATAAPRLAQMKAIAGEFTVEVLDTRNELKGENQTPRLLPKPLYRYNAEQTKTLDGGLYAFVLGTDPEMMLLIECDTVGAKPAWRFGVARMNRDAVRLKHNGEIVWEVPPTKVHSPGDPYLFFDVGLPKGEPKP